MTSKERLAAQFPSIVLVKSGKVKARHGIEEEEDEIVFGQRIARASLHRQISIGFQVVPSKLQGIRAMSSPSSAITSVL